MRANCGLVPGEFYKEMGQNIGGNKRMRGMEGVEKEDRDNAKFTCDPSEEVIR